MQIEFANAAGHRARLVSRVIAACAVSLVSVAAAPASAATLDRIQESGHIKLGYIVNAQPLTSRNDSGAAEGYGVELCKQVVAKVNAQLGRSDIAVDWVPVTVGNLLTEVQQGNVDLVCTPISQTLERRADVAYSIPVFPAGVRAVIRNDAVAGLRDALAGNPSANPVWRGSPAVKVLGQKSFAVVSGTSTESWLAGKLTSFQIDSKIVPVADHEAALQALLDRKVDAVFGDRALVLGAMDTAMTENLTILPRLLTHQPLAFVLARNDDDFRLLVDRALSEQYTADDFGNFYKTWCGAFDDHTRVFFQWVAVGQ